MLRVILDSLNEANNILLEGVNIQKTSFKEIKNNPNRMNGFIKYINKCLSDGDQIIIIKFLDSYDDDYSYSNGKNLKIINLKLTFKSTNLVIKEIVKNKNKTLDFIEEKIYSLENLFQLILLSLVGC